MTLVAIILLLYLSLFLNKNNRSRILSKIDHDDYRLKVVVDEIYIKKVAGGRAA